MTERPSIRSAIRSAIRATLAAALVALVAGGAVTCGGAGQAIPTAVEIDWPDAAPSASAPAPTGADTADAGPAAQR